MDDDTLRETLTDVGLTQYEAEAYVAVLELGSAAATEIADASGVPQARIYDVLRNLESEGYVETYEKGSLHVRARDPVAVVESLESYAGTVESAAGELVERYETPTVENHRVSVVKPLSSIYDRAEEAIADAEYEIQLAMTPALYERFREPLRAAKERGVIVRLTVAPEQRRPLAEAGLDLEFEGVVSEAKYRRLPTPFLAIVDRLQVCFAPEAGQHPAHEYGVLVNDYSLSQIFEWSFETAFWEHWETVYSDRDGGFPTTYTEIRECIRDIEPLLEDNEVIVTVYGVHHDEADENVQLTGRVRSVTIAGDPADGQVPLATFLEEAQIELETADGTFVVGGWGAIFEAIEGRRFVVEAVSRRGDGDEK